MISYEEYLKQPDSVVNRSYNEFFKMKICLNESSIGIEVIKNFLEYIYQVGEEFTNRLNEWEK